MQLLQHKTRLKIWQLTLLAILIMIGFSPIRPAVAQEPIRVLLNGTPLNFGEVPPIEVNGRVLVPLRGVFEALGATVNYDPVAHTITANQGDTLIRLQLDSTEATVNGQSRPLDVPAQARFGRTLVPLRFVSEALGAQVSWNAAQRTVSLASDIAVQGTTPARPNPVTQPPYVPPSQTTPVNVASTIIGIVRKVDVTPPATITVRVNNRDQTYNLADGAVILRQTTGLVTPGTQPTFSNATPIALSNLVPGEEVSLGLNPQNEVVRVSTRTSVISARVRSAQGNQIVLEDRWGTVINFGPTLRYLDPQGRLATTTTLRPGDMVALFIAPSTRAIYQVSANNADITGATAPPYTAPGTTTTGTTQPPTNPPPVTLPTNPVPPGTPQIQLVTHNVTRPFRRGGAIRVTVRGTPGLRGTFDVSPRSQGLALIEEPTRPGVYTGTYTVDVGDDILNGHITAHLLGANGQEAVQQSREPLTLDTIPPRIINTSPADRATVNNAQPNITVQADDIGGSGLARATLTITNNGQTFDAPATVAPPGTVTAIVPRPLSGQATLRVNIADAANNSSSVTFTIFVNGTAGAITSFTHNAARALQPGEDVVVDMMAPAQGKATFDVLSDNNIALAQNIPMREIAAGRYRGSYRIQDNPNAARLRIVGHYGDANNQISTTEATTPVTVLDNTPETLTILQPTENDRAISPLVVRGRAAPNATVDVSVHIAGVRLLIFEYSQDLPTQQVQADANGNWQSQPIELPKVRNVSNLEYTVTATQTDAANRRSDPVTVTLKP